MKALLLVSLLAALALTVSGASGAAASPGRVLHVSPVASGGTVAQAATTPVAAGHVGAVRAATPRGALFKPMTARDIAAATGKSKPTGEVFRGGSRRTTAPPATRTSALATQTPATSSSVPRTAVFGSLVKPGIAAGQNGSRPPAPPDSTGAIGPNSYIEMANSIITVWDRSLVTADSNSFANFAGGGGGSFCDPQIQWDPAAQRFLFSLLQCDIDLTRQPQQFFLYGWSKTATPTSQPGDWCQEGLDTTHAGLGGHALLLDYDKLGHNSGWLMVGGNFYDITASQTNPPFVTAELAWIQLPPNGSTSCSNNFRVFPSQPGVGGNGVGVMINGDGSTPTYTPVPVNTDTNATDGYIVSAYDPSGSNINSMTTSAQSGLAVMHVDAAGTLHFDPDVSVTTYTVPHSVPQPGTTDEIDTLDGRLTQAVGDPVRGIWTQHTVRGGAGAQVDWYELALSGSTLTKVQEGALTDATLTTYYWNAAISPTAGNDGVAIFYNRSTATTNPVIAVENRSSGTPLGTMAPGETVLATSAASDTDFTCGNGTTTPPCRWGDYSGASPDPINTSVVWGTNEVNTAAGSVPAWQNENFAVVANLVPPGKPTGVAASAGDGFVCISWLPPASDTGGIPVLNYTINVYVGASVVKTVVITAPATAACIYGLTDGTTYTFSVTAADSVGSGPESALSGPVTPTRNVSPSAAASFPRPAVVPAPAAPSPSSRP